MKARSPCGSHLDDPSAASYVKFSFVAVECPLPSPLPRAVFVSCVELLGVKGISFDVMRLDRTSYR